MWWHDEEYSTKRGARGRSSRGVYRPPLLLVKAPGGKPRRSSKPGGRQGRRLVPVVVVLAAITAFFWLVILGTQSIGKIMFTENDDFSIRDIVVESDGKQVSDRHVRDWANLREGENLFAVNLEQIRRRLESVPIIEQVVLQRRLPDTLHIRVVERQALAALSLSDYPVPLAIDAKGYVLGPSSRTPSLPVIEGARIPGLLPGSFVDAPDMQYALAVLHKCDTTPIGQQVRIRRVSLADPAHLELTLESGTRVLFGGDDIALRLRKLVALLHTSRQRGVFPEVVDATGERNFVAQYR